MKRTTNNLRYLKESYLLPYKSEISLTLWDSFLMGKTVKYFQWRLALRRFYSYPPATQIRLIKASKKWDTYPEFLTPEMIKHFEK